MPLPPSVPQSLDEDARLAALHRLAVLDTQPEVVFDAITRTASAVCGVPIALVSLVDAQRQWFKSKVGLDADETPREIAFCDHAIRAGDLFEVPDAAADARFADNPLVAGDPNIRFYAGAPVQLSSGERVGTVCVIDRVPRSLNPEQRAMLEGLARIASACLEERRLHLAAAAELAAGQAQYRAIVEDQTELISLAGVDMRLRFVNAAYGRHVGLPPDELVGRSLVYLVAEQDRTAVFDRLQNLCSRGGSLSSVNRIASADGSVRWIEWTNRALPGADGKTEAIHSVGRDITQQHDAELALAASEARFRRLYESTPALMHSIDVQGRIVDISDLWLDTLGYSRSELIGRQSTDLMTPASRRQAIDVVQPALFRDGRCDAVPIEFVRKDGSIIDSLVSATLERDEDGRPLRSLTVVADVTERHRIARELARTHTDLEAIVDNVPAMLGYWDRDGINRFANREYQAAMGLPMSQIQGHTMREVVDAVDPSGYAALHPHVERALAGTRQEFELATLTVDGLRQLQMTLVPDHDEHGGVAGFYGMAYDITGRKSLELRLRESEQQYRALFDNLNSSFALHEMVYDDTGKPVDYRFITMNAMFGEMTGIDIHASRGKCVTELLPGIENDPADWIGLFAEVVRTGVPVHIEQHSQALNRWYEVVAYRAEPRRFAAIALDVTERRKAERERALSEQRLQLLVDAVEDHSMYLLDAAGHVETWNSGAQRIKGYSASEIVGHHLRTFFLPDDAANGEPERQLDIARRDGRFAGEAWRVRKDGSSFWASVTLTAVRDMDGSVIGFTKVTRDLTERRRQQALIEGVATVARSAMVLVDQAGAIAFVNAQAEAMFGFASASLLGRPFDQLLEPLTNGAQQPSGVQDPETAALRGRRIDGTGFDIEVAWSRFDTQDGPAAMAAIIDVTEQRIQRERLEDALSEKDTLLKEVYHRVKNNLQVVQSLLNLQRRAMPDAPSRDAIEDSIQRVRAMALVHEKLYQSGNLSAVALPEYVADLLRQLGEANGAAARGVHLQADIAALETGLDNAIPFGLLITELVTNALKHGFPHKHGGTVRVALQPAPDGTRMTVTDDGDGLPAQFDLATSPSMGLQLAGSLAQQLGGSLTARNDGGAVFEATLSRI